MRTALLIIATLFSSIAYTQDLTGIWRGSFVSTDRLQSLVMPSERYKLEVQIDQHEKVFSSVTYSYKTTQFYGKAVANGTFNPTSGMVWLEETKIVELKMQFGSSACIMTYRLKYSKNDNEEFLEGTWRGYGEKDSASCGKGTVLLHKVLTSDFYKEPFLSKKETEKKPSIEPRKNVDSSKKNTIAGTSRSKLPAKKPNLIAKANPAPSTKPPVSKPAVPPPAVTKTGPPKTTVRPPATNPLVNKGTTQKANSTVKSPPLATRLPESKKLETDPTIAEPDTLKKAVPQVKKSVPIIVPKALSTRENEVVKTITINTREVLINIYDNGTIDHDTVSVYLDNKLVISKKMLTTSPLSWKFTMDDDDDVHELVMVAENEGDIPPNTSLMVVKAGDKEFEVRITSTEQKNAVVIFKYEKPK